MNYNEAKYIETRCMVYTIIVIMMMTYYYLLVIYIIIKAKYLLK